MLDKALVMGVAETRDPKPWTWCTQILCEIVGIILTMFVEGILGRRQCLITYASIILVIGVVLQMMEKSPSLLISYETKYSVEKVCRDVICLFFGPMKSLLILFTLSVYPTSMR